MGQVGDSPFVVAVAMAVSFWTLRRVQGSSRSWLSIRITGRVRLNRSAELVLVEVDNERFLIGATPANINTIAKWPADVTGNDALGPQNRQVAVLSRPG